MLGAGSTVWPLPVTLNPPLAAFKTVLFNGEPLVTRPTCPSQSTNLTWVGSQKIGAYVNAVNTLRHPGMAHCSGAAKGARSHHVGTIAFRRPQRSVPTSVLYTVMIGNRMGTACGVRKIGL